jgi:NAD(P)-dependent dehydrogenase (short-subunit alcohol dehydrogenase family)
MPHFSILSLMAVSRAVVTSPHSVLVSGGNQGQGYALCERILAEHANSHVFLGARHPASGAAAVARLEAAAPGRVGRVECVQLDVTDDASVAAAQAHVAGRLGQHKLHGLVSNAGVLWGRSLDELLAVNTFGVHRLCEAFVPLVRPVGGRVVIVSSGMGPLMHGYASPVNAAALLSFTLTWANVEANARTCLATAAAGGGAAAFEAIGFGGGPFAEAAVDFHMYGLSKAFADAYMLTLARAHPRLFVNSCDPGLVFTELMREIPRFASLSREEAGAKTPAEGVEAAMQLLFGAGEWVQDSGLFFAMNKDQTELLRSPINVRPEHAAAARLQVGATSLLGDKPGSSGQA